MPEKDWGTIGTDYAHHVVYTFDAATTTEYVYLDGAQVYTGTFKLPSTSYVSYSNTSNASNAQSVNAYVFRSHLVIMVSPL